MGLFEQASVLTSIIIGLGITHLLRGDARLIQRSETERLYPVHVYWVGYLFLTLIFQWWWEFRLGEVEVWTFQWPAPQQRFHSVFALVMLTDQAAWAFRQNWTLA